MTQDFDYITRELEFQLPISRVWRAITEPQELSLWFGSEAQFVLKEDSLGYFEWQNECEGRFAIKIITINAPHYFAWRWMLKRDVDFEFKGSTLVEWKLSETAKGTKLVMIESGFASAKHHQMNEEGWQQELADLISYLNH